MFFSMIVFILFPLNVPRIFSPLVENPVFLLILFVSVISIFLYYNPLLGILSVFAVYELLLRNSASFSSYGGGGGGGGGSLGNSASSSHKQKKTTNNESASAPVDSSNRSITGNNTPYSLEEEAISLMAPLNSSPQTPNAEALSFHPVAENTHDALTF